MADDHGLDLGPAFREALLGASAIAPLLSVWSGEPAVFTRRPVPDDASYPMVLVNDPASLTDADALNSPRPIWQGDIVVYGNKRAPGSPEDQTREVQQIALAVRILFHRQKWALQVGGFHVIDVRASGPVPAPVDDDQTVGRLVSLIVRLGRDT